VISKRRTTSLVAARWRAAPALRWSSVMEIGAARDRAKQVAISLRQMRLLMRLVGHAASL
jgi:hypothetical protein